MAGFLDQMQGEPNAAPTAPPQGAQGGRQATPYEQKAYDIVVMQALQLIFEPDFGMSVINEAQKGDPAQALADGVLRALMVVRDSAADAGHEVNDLILAKAADIVTPAAATLFVAAEMMSEEEAVEVARKAYMLGLQQAQDMGMGADLLNGGGGGGIS